MDDWETNENFDFDGYFLSQRNNDASRTPLFIPDDDDITAMSINDFPEESTVLIYAFTAWPVPGSLPSAQSSYRYHIRIMSGEQFPSQGTQTAAGPLAFYIYFEEGKDPESAGSNPWINMTLESGKQIKAYLPPNFGGVYSEEGVAFWVTEDGSTYWGDSGQGMTAYPSTVSDVFDMDAYYATRWESSNLARAAYDSAGASPAVDAGSRDYLSGGTTKTELDNGDDIPDNEPPDTLYGFDNQDSSGNIVAWENANSVMAGSGDDLDIGYHYGAALYDSSRNETQNPSSAEYAVTLRYPKESYDEDAYDYNVGGETLQFDINAESVKQIAIASSAYDNNGTMEEKTLACFPSSQEKDEDGTSHLLIFCKRFRGAESGSISVVDHYSAGDEVEMLDIKVASLNMATAANADDGNMDEPVYLTVATNHVIPVQNTPKVTNLYVYRYDPTDDSWDKIAQKSETLESEDPNFVSAAVAADDDDACVFWNYNTGGAGSKIYGYTLEDATTIQSAVNIPTLTNALVTSDIDEWLDADWDTEISKPRITWTEKSGGYYNTRAALVDFDINTHQPESLSKNYQIYNNGSYDSHNPSICVSRAPRTYDSTSDDVAESYVSCTSGEYSADSFRIDLQASSTTDYWQTPVTYQQNISPKETHTTYRYFGQPKQITLQNGNDVYIDRRMIDISNANHYAKTTTNRNNGIDIFAAYVTDTTDKVIIRQVSP